MKVITWNMGYPWYRNQHDEAWKYIIEKIDIDLALLQETVPSDELEDDGKVVWRCVKGNPWGSGIYSKDMPIKLIPLSKYRGWVTAAEVGMSNDRKIIAVSIHAPINEKGFIRPTLDNIFLEIQPIIESNNFLVGGDLNACRLFDTVYGTTHHNEFFDYIESKGFFNCHRKFHNEEQQTFWGPRTKNPYQNDHLFIDATSSEVLKSCYVVPYEGDIKNYSDHAPVFAEIII